MPGTRMYRYRKCTRLARKLIDAQHSDLFDVLNYIAHTRHPLRRAERVGARRGDSVPLRRQAAGLPRIRVIAVCKRGGERVAMEKLPHF